MPGRDARDHGHQHGGNPFGGIRADPAPPPAVCQWPGRAGRWRGDCAMIGREGPVAGRIEMNRKSNRVHRRLTVVGMLAAAGVAAAALSVRCPGGRARAAALPRRDGQGRAGHERAADARCWRKLRPRWTAGGPAAAVDVCRTEARTIAEAVALKQGIELGRTSHRVRNPANAPRPWARAIVEGSAGAKAAAEQIRVVDLGDRVGVLRPIGTADACTRCHGAADEVQSEPRRGPRRRVSAGSRHRIRARRPPRLDVGRGSQGREVRPAR